MRLLLFNLATDAADPVLGFGSVWIRELAGHCAAIDVVTMYRGTVDLPSNVRVYSAGREHGWSRARRLAAFYRHLTRLLSARRYDVCFAHMMPLFAALAGPLLKARGIPLVLWYAHRQETRQLRLGAAMSWRAVTSVATSFPVPTDKLRVVGQGIDTDFYSPAEITPTLNPCPHQEGGTFDPAKDFDTPLPPGRPLILQVARLAAIKHQATTIRAAAGSGAQLVFVGGVQPGCPDDYLRELEALCAELGGGCRFTGDLAAAGVRDWNRRATIAVNTSPVGLFDKSALESMACALPTVVCNPAFAPVLGEQRDLLMIDGPEDVTGLRERLAHLLALPEGERARIGRALRQGVMREHSLKTLIKRLLSVFESGELPAE
ncbi:MAG: glycosyltransferase family 4 protein [Chloroflexota bacterium]|nr:glycosyltransferase family 4 protein [Chloroflexota bacterium]